MMWWFTGGGGVEGGSALILSQQTGCMLGGVSPDTLTGKDCIVGEGGGVGVRADTRLPLNY